MRFDVWAYVIGGFGGLVLAFAGAHEFQNKSVTIIAFGTGAITVIIGGCLYWQDAIWKQETARSESKDSVSERAWINITRCELIKIPAVGEVPRIKIDMTNAGKTPALNTNTRATVFTRDNFLESDIPVLRDDPILSKNVIGSGSTHSSDLEGETPISSQDELDRIVASSRKIYVVGTIFYDDVFKQSHITRFCYEISGRDLARRSMNACAFGNTVD